MSNTLHTSAITTPGRDFSWGKKQKRDTNLQKNFLLFQSKVQTIKWLVLKDWLLQNLGLPWWHSGKDSACNAGDANSTPGSEDPLEKGMANHSTILAWRVPWTEEPGGPSPHGVTKSQTRRSDQHYENMKIDTKLYSLEKLLISKSFLILFYHLLLKLL